MLRIGLISDTHNLVRPEAMAALRGCDHVIHAGDIMGPAVLDQLATLGKPVTAVRGNNDKGAWAAGLAETEFIQLGEVFVYCIHNLAELDIDPGAAGVKVVISGHTHKPVIEERHGVLYVNPGSAGPRRFTLPICCAELVIEGTSVSARIINLEIKE